MSGRNLVTSRLFWALGVNKIESVMILACISHTVLSDATSSKSDFLWQIPLIFFFSHSGPTYGAVIAKGYTVRILTFFFVNFQMQ